RAAADARHVDARLGREQTRGELLLRHFERAEQYARAVLLGGGCEVVLLLRLAHDAARGHVSRDVVHERGLAQDRAGRDDVEVTRVEPRALTVQAREPRRYSGDASPALLRFLEDLEGAHHRIANRLDRRALGQARDVEHRLLRLVDELLDVRRRRVPLGGEALAGRDELTQTPLFTDHLRMGGHVRDRGRRVRELGEIRRAADLLQTPAIPEVAGDRDDIDGTPSARQLDDRLEDAPVRVGIEVL